MKLKVVVKKLQRSLLQAKNWGPRNTGFGLGQEMVPEDVKEGYFAVIASNDDEERRFVVPLAYLDQPSFQRLLERATEVYGFSHEGALMVPCSPSELEWMLAKRAGFKRWCMLEFM
ncbi:auxin-induced protein 15A-like [Bidens hawaiensis]|uniref:auxin-induced protein 15A-like n=1 Tax=Bidens hawaiensis TaxID=980011 RepID=UPI00404B30B7